MNILPALCITLLHCLLRLEEDTGFPKLESQTLGATE